MTLQLQQPNSAFLHRSSQLLSSTFAAPVRANGCAPETVNSAVTGRTLHCWVFQASPRPVPFSPPSPHWDFVAVIQPTCCNGPPALVPRHPDTAWLACRRPRACGRRRRRFAPPPGAHTRTRTWRCSPPSAPWARSWPTCEPRRGPGHLQPLRTASFWMWRRSPNFTGAAASTWWTAPWRGRTTAPEAARLRAAERRRPIA